MVHMTRNQPTTSWSLYPSLHEAVSEVLVEDGLHFNFHDADDETAAIETRDTNIMGRFICQNQVCRAKGWSSKMIAVTIRLYTRQRYNARAYHQRCKSCNSLSRPTLDWSYTERVSYWIKQWNGIPVERPPVSNDSRGPHNRRLCEGCRAGHCTQSAENLITQMERSVHFT